MFPKFSQSGFFQCLSLDFVITSFLRWGGKRERPAEVRDLAWLQGLRVVRRQTLRSTRHIPQNQGSVNYDLQAKYTAPFLACNLDLFSLLIQWFKELWQQLGFMMI